MDLHLVGINIEKSTQSKIESVAKRFEPLFLTLVQEIQKSRATDSIDTEAVLISTCNRVEVIAYSTNQTSKKLQHILRKHGAPAKELLHKQGIDVSRHLIEVVAGMHSEVLGETMVSSQIKGAYTRALSAGITGKITNRLFQRAQHIVRQIREATGESQRIQGIIQQGIKLINRSYALQNLDFCLVGQGTLLNKFANALLARGSKKKFQMIRDYRENEEGIFNLTEGREKLSGVKLVLIESSSMRFDVRLIDVEALRRSGEEILLLDLSLTRGVDPICRQFEGIMHYSRDELDPIDRTQIKDQKLHQVTNAFISREVEQFETWLSSLKWEKIFAILVGEIQQLFVDVNKKSPNKKSAEKKFKERLSKHFKQRLRVLFNEDDSRIPEILQLLTEKSIETSDTESSIHSAEDTLLLFS